ncbi:E3 ubiquitin-protein ligase TRIM63-like [Branchiostoma floridae]|uniref:E3 ubiquitin-protein ligase TRIM63-like n=1 Tax=Branchiostoma floridae TaxID=7739 RepID=A0A9J7KHZ9_BRAFL|nr:E3 ubiquitin-protein ligase TRIM63-like [Branchiostoma floridae]
MATAPPSLQAKFEEELSCSICLELFTRPKMLPCQHTFCQDCLKDHAGRGGTFQCPKLNCCQQINLPNMGVADFPSNTTVANLCDTLRKRTTRKNEDHVHKVKCTSHPSEDINLYCIQCQVPVCTKCLGEGHKGHSTTNLEAASQERKVSAKMLITEARKIMETYNKYLQDLRNKETALNTQKQERNDKIDEALHKAVQQLTEAKDSLKSKEDQEHTKTIKVLQAQKNEVLTDFAEISSACMATMKGLEKGGVELLCTETTLHEVVTKCKEKSLPTPMSVPTVEFQPTDPETLTLGKLSSHKPSWLWKIIGTFWLLLKASVLAIWWLGFFAMGFTFLMVFINHNDKNTNGVILIVTLLVLSFSISLYSLVQKGKLRSSSLLLFAICHVFWLSWILSVKLGNGKYDEVLGIMAPVILSCIISIGFIWKNN